MAPNRLSIAFGWKCDVIAHLDARSFHRGDHKLAVRLGWSVTRSVAIKDYALHGSRVDFLSRKFVVIALVRRPLKISRKRAKPADHVRPRQKNGNRDDLIRGILCVPAIDRNRI